MRCWALLPAAYVAAGLATFAWTHEERWANSADAEVGPVVAGMIWPVYWSSKGALELVRGLKRPRPLYCVRPDGRAFSPDDDGYCRFREKTGEASPSTSAGSLELTGSWSGGTVYACTSRGATLPTGLTYTDMTGRRCYVPAQGVECCSDAR